MHTDCQGQSLDVWIGTGGAPSKGIYHCSLDAQTGKLSASRLAAEINSPGFLAMHPVLARLYAVGSLDGKAVVAEYHIQRNDGYPELRFSSSAQIGDGGATHISVSRDGAALLTAQYGAGSVAAFALGSDGQILRRTALVKHRGGSGVVAGRQDAPHAHWVGFSPDLRFAFAPDLGLDKVVIYRVETKSAELVEHGAGQLPPGAGPRHMKFHPNGTWIYVLNELNLSVSLFDWDAVSGQMTLRETVPTVPQAQLERLRNKSCSEIRVHPSGRFIYAANRGHDTVTVFSVGDDGRLREIQNEPVRGATPRNINLDPSGQWLLAAGQDSHTLASFAIDQQTGIITYANSVISTPAPICVLFAHE
ncbi:MAG: lactonase family protein [Pirellulaceae bacterium]|nr:lactonase family protein [Pirellulaceae bacterium]